MVEAALIAALALAVFIGAGIVGNPWYRIVTIEGGSMEPTISRGDLIMVAPAPSKVEPGMILVMTWAARSSPTAWWPSTPTGRRHPRGCEPRE